MKIKYATATGADDSIKPFDIIELNKRYSHAEFGILLSKHSQGGNRFPSKSWMEELAKHRMYLSGSEQMEAFNLSGHLCGQWVRDVMEKGDLSFTSDIPLWNDFQRIQLNTHGITHKLTNDGIQALRYISQKLHKAVICQVDGVNDELFKKMLYAGILSYPLFDMSHGAGVLPKDWTYTLDSSISKTSPHILRGYAGGLSAESLEAELVKIEKLVGKDEIWIDFETLARKNRDRQFDLQKVENFVKIAERYK